MTANVKPPTLTPREYHLNGIFVIFLSSSCNSKIQKGGVECIDYTPLFSRLVIFHNVSHIIIKYIKRIERVTRACASGRVVRGHPCGALGAPPRLRPAHPASDTRLGSFTLNDLRPGFAGGGAARARPRNSRTHTDIIKPRAGRARILIEGTCG